MGYGYATQALEFVLNYSFNELNLKKVIAETQTQNKASIKLLERVGMIFGKSVERFGSNQSIFLLLVTSISINIKRQDLILPFHLIIPTQSLLVV